MTRPMAAAPAAQWVFAMRLAETAEGELACRNAIGRIYYATFHLVCASVGGSLAGEHVHQALLAALRQRGPSAFKAAWRLNSLRRLRVHADYEVERPLPPDAVRTACHHASAVLELMNLSPRKATSS